MTNRNVPLPEVLPSERLLVQQLSSGFFHVIVRYGYAETILQSDGFMQASSSANFWFPSLERSVWLLSRHHALWLCRDDPPTVMASYRQASVPNLWFTSLETRVFHGIVRYGYTETILQSDSFLQASRSAKLWSPSVNEMDVVTH